MKCSANICHRPYAPPTVKLDAPYVCRLAPAEKAIALEWFDKGNGTDYRLFYTVRYANAWKSLAVTPGTMVIEGLERDTEYELYIESDEGKRSNLRLARTGAIPPDTCVINYLHPEDKQYQFSGQYLCSPSLVKTESGRLIAGMDVFGPSMGQNTTLLFASDDDGKSWHYLCDLYPFYWSSLFYHKHEIYIIGLTTEYGNLQISRSKDEGVTWEEPTTIMYGANLLCATGGISREPMHLTEYQGRYYTSCAYGSWKTGGHLPAVLSVDVNADLMKAKSWSCSEFLPFEGKWKEEAGIRGDAIEGNFVVAPDGKLYDYMRWKKGEMLKLRVNTDDPDAPMEYVGIEEAPTSNSMFRIIPHKDHYLLVSNRKSRVQEEYSRNCLSLFESKDLKEYTLVKDIINMEDKSPRKFGFQYPTFVKDGNQLYLSIRSAFNDANSFHNSNYILFYRTTLD